MAEKDILTKENEKLEEQLAVISLTPENAEFYRTPGGFAGLKFKGEDFGHINIFRTFPFSAPNEFLTVRKLGDKMEEIGIIEDLKVFDDATAKLINFQLELRYFMPKILKIISLKDEYGHTYWNVLTDKGRCKFTSASGAADSVTKTDNRVIIKDTDGNRFEIEDISKLSVKEMKKIDLYL